MAMQEATSTFQDKLIRNCRQKMSVSQIQWRSTYPYTHVSNPSSPSNIYGSSRSSAYDHASIPINLNLKLAMMYSFKRSHSLVYSSDIRWRMVYQRCQMGLSYHEIGKRWNVDPSTVHRTVQLFEETGEVFSI